MKVTSRTPFSITDIDKVILQFPDRTDIIHCTGNITGSTEMRTLVKKCEGIESEINIPQRMKLNATMYVSNETVNDIYGLKEVKDSQGIYSYNVNSRPKWFKLVARFKDDFTGVEKIIALPNCKSTVGFNFIADTESSDVNKITLEFEALADKRKSMYYEAVVDEDKGLSNALADKWEYNFDIEKMVPHLITAKTTIDEAEEFAIREDSNVISFKASSSEDITVLITDQKDFNKYIVLKAGVPNRYKVDVTGVESLIFSCINNLDAIVNIEDLKEF